MTITIKREGLKLSLIGGDFPARGSSDVPIQLQSDGSYSGYMITPQFGWYQNGAWKEAAGTYDDGIKLPAQMYRTSGYCYLALALAQTGNAGHVEVTNQIQIPVPLAPHGSSVLPDEPTMQITSPLFTDMSIFLSTSCSPNDLLRFSILIIFSAILHPPLTAPPYTLPQEHNPSFLPSSFAPFPYISTDLPDPQATDPRRRRLASASLLWATGPPFPPWARPAGRTA